MQQWGQQKRDAYISDLFDAFEKLSATPQIAAIAAIADEIRKGYQKFLQGSHIIFFQVCELHSIEIIRVLHKRMDADAQLNSL
jgi:toxin ParE1/3/4